MPLGQAMARTIGVNAVKGDYRSQKLMLDVARSVKADEDTDDDGPQIIEIQFV